MKQEVYEKYIKGNQYMELADSMGIDIYEAYLVSEIDKVDDELELIEKNEKNYNFLSFLVQRKTFLNEVREAYKNLKG